MYEVGSSLTLMCVALVLYLLPTVIAAARGRHDVIAICAFNLVFGWTVVGWAGAMTHALSRVD